MPGSSRAIFAASYASFALIGWSMLLVPSLIRDIKSEFGQTDAGIGLLYLVSSILFATGAFLSGALAGRLGRRVILPSAALLLAAGLMTQAFAPAWTVFVVGAALAGGGAGALDASVNGVIMDVGAASRGAALNSLHLFYSVGALAAPLTVGLVVGAGVSWRLPVAAAGVAALLLIVPIRPAGTVPPHPRVAQRGLAIGHPGPDLRLPLLALAIAISCYVATEAGLTSWLVAFLADETVTAATLALSLFWASLALGRLIASRIADRFRPVPFAASCVLFSAAALTAALVGPTGAVQIALFAAVGFGLGPVYPMIMAIAGGYYPHRAAAVSGLLTAAAVAGSIVYPPLMGLMSEVAGLGAGMAGAVILSVVCGIAIVVAGRGASRRPTAERVPAPDAAAGSG